MSPLTFLIIRQPWWNTYYRLTITIASHGDATDEPLSYGILNGLPRLTK